MENTKVEIKKTQDIWEFSCLIRIFHQVFDHQKLTLPCDTYLESLLQNPEFHVWVVKRDNQVIGGATVYVLQQYYIEKKLAYIYDVGIASDFQRLGFGQALIKKICAYYKAQNLDEAYVQAETEDEQAVNPKIRIRKFRAILEHKF